MPPTPDELCQTDAERACLTALRDSLGAASPMERHCTRQFLICERLAGGEQVDRELLLCACWLHDAGLREGGDQPYVTASALLVERVLAPFAWPADRLQRCMDACEQHHAQTSRKSMGLEVELVRQSDLVDVSRGLVSFGVDRAWLKQLFADIPWKGLWPTISKAFVAELRSRPKSVGGVFFPSRRAVAR